MVHLKIRGFVDGAARAFYVSWYADAVENGEIIGHGAGPGEDWMDVAPGEVPAWAYKAAAMLVGQLPGKLEELLPEWEETWTNYKFSDQKFSAKLCGHYAAMSAMGSGVGLRDFGIDTMMPYVGEHDYAEFPAQCWSGVDEIYVAARIEGEAVILLTGLGEVEEEFEVSINDILQFCRDRSR